MKSSKVLYHYCSMKSFYSIIQSKSLLLSSLTQGNDALEGKLVARTIKRVIQEDKSITMTEADSLSGALENFHYGIVADALGFCLSEEGDLLSQWRGYAENATGVSIGFSREYLIKLCKTISPKFIPMTLNKVLYSEAQHDKNLRPMCTKLGKYIKSGALDSFLNITGAREIKTQKEINKIREFFFEESIKIFQHLFILKNYGFREEREWRLISIIDNIFEDFKTEEFFYGYRNKVIIPQRRIILSDLGALPIEHVILGPRNKTPLGVVQGFMHTNNFESIPVMESEASYR